MNKKIIDLSDRTNMFYWQTNRKITAKQMKKIFLDRRNTVSREDTINAIEYGMTKAGKTITQAKVSKLSDPIPRGSVNNVLKAELNDGSEVVVRMHPYFVQNGYFWSEKVATEEARKKGVPVFKTYYVDDSKKKFDFDYMIMEALPGNTLQDYWPIEKVLDAKLMYETGAYVGMTHKVRPEGFGFFLNEVAKKENRLQGQYETFKAHFYAGLDEDLRFLTKTKLFSGIQAKKIIQIFEKHDDYLDCKNPSLIHNDVADWNELSDGKKITGIVDWDECFSGDPIMDFAQWSLFFDNNRQKHFIEGYKTVAPLPEGYQEKEHFFRLRYVVSKLHLRKKRASVVSSTFLEDVIKRGMDVMREEFKHFGL
jgi:fructosamine-3-kinase